MEELKTVSKVVDETFEESVLQQNTSGAVLVRSQVTGNGRTPDQVTPETSNDLIELTLAVGNETEVENETTEAKYFDNPAFDNEVVFDNKAAFENEAAIDHEDIKPTLRRKSFADVVTKLINDPIKIDIHPFGRGSIYSRALGGVQPRIPREEGAMFIWALATLIILGVAVGVIAMSLMYQANQRLQYTAKDALTDSNVTSHLQGVL